MEEYLQYMKTLRSQMNDVEDQAAKISVEEQMHLTTIQTLEKDLQQAKSETLRLKEETDLMVKEKGQICSQILDRHRKFSTLEADSCNLTQTLELIQQERAKLSANLVEKSTYYSKVFEEMNTKLGEYQAKGKCVKEGDGANIITGKSDADHLMAEDMADMEHIKERLDDNKAKFDMLTQMKSRLISEFTKGKETLEQRKCRIREFQPELRDMDREALEEELQALLSDRSGETEYFQSLQNQIERIKGISHMVKCECGGEYRIEMNLCAC